MHPNTREALRLAKHPSELSRAHLVTVLDTAMGEWLEAPWWRPVLRLRLRFCARLAYMEILDRDRLEELARLSEDSDDG